MSRKPNTFPQHPGAEKTESQHELKSLTTNPETADRRIRRVLELLAKDAPGRLQVHDLSEAVHLSNSYLRHLFKQQVGISLARYLKLLRMRRAAELLQTSFLSVKEVMSRVGIADMSHFARDYKAMFGRTPSQQRFNEQRRKGGGPELRNAA